MHSFRASHNQIQWKLIVRGEVVGWHAFQRSFPVVVRPSASLHASTEEQPMNEPEIFIRLDENGRTYLPGTTLSGEYRIEAVGQNRQAIEVSVLWYSEGKGDEDLAVHEFWRKDADSAELGDPRRPTASAPPCRRAP